jgi:hypothetical protein
MNEEIGKLYLMKSKSFCCGKGTVQIMKTSYRLGKIFEKHLSDKELTSRLYEELLKLNNKENQFLKMVR